MIKTDLTILAHMTALSESVRCRVLLLLEAQELTVSDLCAVLQLPQSTVSRHLKHLQDHGWVRARRDGTRRLYHSTIDEREASARQLWDLTRAAVEATPAHELDRERLRGVLERVQSRYREFFDVTGDRWEGLRDELFGRDFYLHALVALLPELACVADLGCGTGTVSRTLAPFVRRVIGVDGSPAMLEHAESQLDGFDNVELRLGELESLPLNDGEADIATLILVLHHVQRPATVLQETARCLRPGGRVLIVDMLPHDREQYRHEMGHVWLGFSREEIVELLNESGFDTPRVRALPPDPEAKGPNLFVVTANLKE